MQAINAIGRRKTSVARVYLKSGSGKITINKSPLEKYFPLETQRNIVTRPFTVTDTLGKYDLSVNVDGGGVSGQAGAVSLGVARALISASEEHRAALRANDLMTRDPRMVERKKYGQKKARKKFQFSKR
jgi:small subunit ribosomal protein S9